MRQLLLFSAFLFGCAATSPSVSKTSRAPAVASAPLQLTEERVNALIRDVAALRGLPPKAAVPIYLLEKQPFVAALHELIDRGTHGTEHSSEDAFVRGFHLTPQSTPTGRTSTTREVLDEQVAAFYDHERRYIVVRKSHPRNKEEADKELGTLAHEIEHALQDQHFQRADIDKMEGLDEAFAYRAVLEGDAMLAMIAFQSADRGIPFSRAIRKISDVVRLVSVDQFVQSERGTALQSALPLMRERLIFPYHAGAGFVADLYRAGGLSLVNGLFVNRPKSTEQILHPEKYIAGELPVPVGLPKLPQGYEPISSDAMGELQIRIVLSQCAPQEIAKKAAAGWGGDRYTLVKAPDGTIALLWTTVWDDDAEAAEFAQVLATNPTCLGGGITISTDGNKVGITRGLPEPIAKEQANFLLTRAGDKPKSVPIGNYFVPLNLPPPPEKGVFWGQTYTSRWMGISGLMPYGFVGQIGTGSTELRLSLPGFGVTGAILLSDKMTVPRFLDELFQDIARGLTVGTGGQFVPTGGGPILTPLGAAVDRYWSVSNSSTTVRAVVVPVCNGTGSYIFLQSWSEPSGKEALDYWLNSFRWTTAAPPICGLLNPQ